jgi:hypothetical protein
VCERERKMQNIFFFSDTVLGYGLDDQGFRVQVPAGAGNFSLHHHAKTGSGTNPASYPWALSLGAKWLGCEAEDSTVSSTKVKNMWSYTSTPQLFLHGIMLI